MKDKFQTIAAYDNEDFAPARERLLNDEAFLRLLGHVDKYAAGKITTEQIIGLLHQSNTRKEFDKLLVIPFFQLIEQFTTSGVSLSGYDTLPKSGKLFLTNHRDIILDAAFLSVHIYLRTGERPYMGIGNNLFVRSWIEDLVRLCRCFSVIRNGSPKELLQNSQTMSEYISTIIEEDGEDVWIAQREGRAKDSNDLTQGSVLKMLTLAGEGDFLERIERLNICPVSITYEYDACDWLKAKEFQLKRDNPNYKKSQEDDFQNMREGLMSQKGRVAYQFTGCINKELQAVREATNVRNQQVQQVAEIIDRHIHRGYHFFPTQLAAYSIMLREGITERSELSDKYIATEAEIADFEKFIQSRIAKIQLEQKDEQFLRNRLIEMYGNPVRNQIKALS